MEYTITTDQERLGEAADYVDAVADQYGSGTIAIYYTNRNGNPAPWIDTGYLSPEGLEVIRHRYTVRKGAPHGTGFIKTGN